MRKVISVYCSTEARETKRWPAITSLSLTSLAGGVERSFLLEAEPHVADWLSEDPAGISNVSGHLKDLK